MDKVYISFQKSSEVSSRKITIGDIASVYCKDNSIQAKIKSLPIISVPETESRRYVVTAIKVFSVIEENVNGTELINLGGPEFVVSYKKEKKQNKVTDFLKVILASVVIFCGSAFAIMAYDNDVDINGIFETMSKWVTGDNKAVFLQQVMYSLGLFLGIMIFYNRIGKRKSVKDPTPLDIQMRLYEDDINTTIINNSEREEKQMMWNEFLLIVLFSLGAGFVTSCGYFALFMTVGVISRIVQFTHTAGRERFYENLVITGVTVGNAFFTFTPYEFLPSAVWVVFSVFAGMYTGCFLISLAEAVKGIPVFQEEQGLGQVL